MPRRVGRRRAYQQEHLVADRIAPAMRRALEAAFRRAGEAFPVKRTAALFAQGQTFGLMTRVPWQDVVEALTADIRQLIVDGVSAAARQQSIPGVVVKQPEFRFDITNPRAIEWIRRHAAELVTRITEDQRRAVSRIIQRMFEDGVPPEQAARELRQVVGLHERYALAVDNYRRGLTEQGMDRELRDARVAQYADRLRANRARVIARTESISASAHGTQELWRQARDTGLLDESRTKREWLVTPDERLCEICEPMEGQQVGLEEPFTTGEGLLVDTPPAHVQCRCAMRLVFTPLT